jgi:hypothetical protein
MTFLQTWWISLKILRFCVKLIMLIKYWSFMTKSCSYHQESLTFTMPPLRTWWPVCGHDEFCSKHYFWHEISHSKKIRVILMAKSCWHHKKSLTINIPPSRTWWPFCRHDVFRLKWHFLLEIGHFNKIWVIYAKELLIPSGSSWPLTYHHRKLDDLFADMMNFVQNFIFGMKLAILKNKSYLWQKVADTIRSPWPLTYHHWELDDLFADMMYFV